MNEEIVCNLDFPTENVNIYNKRLIVSGWAFSKKGNQLEIEIHIDGNLCKKAQWGLPQFHPFQSFHSEQSYESGFIGKVNLQSFGDGNHLVEVKAKSPEVEKLIQSVNIRVEKRKNNDPLIPKFTLVVGPKGRFKERGKRYVNNFVELGNLKPTDKVLEMGCGMGRLALPLTKFLKDKGEYNGFDIVPESIDFCTKNITSRYPNFHFFLSNTYNKFYNKTGNLKGIEYKFPYENESTDFVYLISVFTHLVLKDMEHYLSEISRILKVGQKCFITFFLYGNENNRNDKSEPQDHDFKYEFDGFRAIDKEIPELAIAYDEKFIRKLYEKNGLRIIEPIHYRLDKNSKVKLVRQDFIVAEKIS